MYGYNLGLGSGGNRLPHTPGIKSGLELDALTTSRRWAPKPLPASDDVVTVSGCTYRFDGTGSFVGDAGPWGTAKYIELQMTTDSDEYSKSSTGTCTIDSVEYDWTITTRAIDTTPTAFSFDTIFDADTSTEYESNSITVLGIDATATPAITVTGLEYSINSGAYTSDAGTVELDDTVTVKLTSSSEYETPVSGTLTIGGVSATFTATTREAITTPTAFSFTDVTDAEIETLTESDAITIAGVEVAVAFTVTGGEAEKNDSGTWAASGTVVATDTVKVRATSSSEYETAVGATLTIGGVSDTFTVTTAAYVEPSAGFPFTFPFNLG